MARSRSSSNPDTARVPPSDPVGGGLRVVVIGATGNVGTSVVERLAHDDRVSAIVGVARRQPEWAPAKTVFVPADVGGDDLEPIVDGADAVIHLAWLFQPTHHPLVTWKANAIGSTNVFRAVASCGVPTLVYASSVGAYSPAPGRLVDESWPTHSMPTCAYGREKAYVERTLDAFELRNPACRVVRMRPSFIFKRPAATEQRRLFLGPGLPNNLVRPGRLPCLPLPADLRFQATHADDIAAAYHEALFRDVSGAFNLAADPVVDSATLAGLLDTKVVTVPRAAVRAAVAVAWHLRVVPADPALLDLFLALPLMDSTRARTELEWKPVHSAIDALGELIDGLADGAGMRTPPLQKDSIGSRLKDMTVGVERTA